MDRVDAGADPVAGVTRAAAEASLQRLAGPDATFRDGQFEAIQALVNGQRSVVVQRTGWGKSAVYFIACDLLRGQGQGPVLVLSPLLVLMRNQIEAATRLGLRAVTINSSLSTDERAQALEELPEADMLFVTPESLHARRFAQDVLGRIQALSAVVVDEVHCISEWGHNFRPKYRRIKDFLDQLPSNIGVLGTTATATARTIDDIVEQLGDDIMTMRGPLVRSSLRLHVIPPAAKPWRMAWLAKFVAARPPAGIVYVLTVPDAERVAAWLVSQGIDAAPYTGQMSDADRREVEQRLVANEVDAVVATTALGMGYDKPDLRWVVHFQVPAGPVTYYQQVGRAGRGVDVSHGVMLQGHDDDDVHDWFIASAYPAEELAIRLLSQLDASDTGLTVSEILSHVNIGRGRLDAALVILEDDGVIRREGSRYHRTTKRYVYPRERVEAVAAARRREYELIRAYGRGEGCLMEILQTALDDPTAAPCGRCGPCTGNVPPFEPDPGEVQRARDFLWQLAGVFEPRRMWPPAADLPVTGRIPDDHVAQPGRILGRYQDGGYGDEALSARAAGQPSDVLTRGIEDLLEQWAPQVGWVSWVPSNTYDRFLQQVAEAVAERLGVECHPSLVKPDDAVPQQSMQNSQQAAANAWTNLTVHPRGVSREPVLLVDDVVNTKWTMTVATHRLVEAGSGPVHPLVLCELVRATS
jgi:ATP-dependent DNA helicase RecQ